MDIGEAKQYAQRRMIEIGADMYEKGGKKNPTDIVNTVNTIIKELTQQGFYVLCPISRQPLMGVSIDDGFVNYMSIGAQSRRQPPTNGTGWY